MSTGRELLVALEDIGGPIEWCRCVSADSPTSATRPPMTAWRFAHPNRRLHDCIAAAVAEYRGSVRWLASVGQNWVIQPEAVANYSRRPAFANDVELAIAFFEEYPGLVRAAFEDMPLLAEHLRHRCARAPC